MDEKIGFDIVDDKPDYTKTKEENKKIDEEKLKKLHEITKIK